MNELEYKWKLSDKSIINNFNKIINDKELRIISSDIIKIEAQYYDTEDLILKNNKMALRKRKENGETICCLKTSKTPSHSNFKIREEYEIKTDNIYDVISYAKRKNDKNKVFKQLENCKFNKICDIKYTRKSIIIEYKKHDTCVMELCLDEGFCYREYQSVAFSEIELEYTAGSIEMFHQFAEIIEKEFKLEIQTKSKIAQAMEYNKKEEKKYVKTIK